MFDCIILKMSAKKKPAKAGTQRRPIARKAQGKAETQRTSKVQRLRTRAHTREQHTQTEPREAMQRVVRANFERLHMHEPTPETRKFMEACFDDGGHSQVGLRDAQLFGYRRGGSTLVQCAQCNEVSHHACLAATGAELAQRVLQPEERGEVQCRVCFRELANSLERAGHMLVHSPRELALVGLHEQLLLRYVAEKYPRASNAAVRTAMLETRARSASDEGFPLGELLALNAACDDGLSGLLLRKLPGAAGVIAECVLGQGAEGFWGLSEPSRWVVTRAARPGDRQARWELSFEELDGELYDRFRPVALLGDGTFTPGLSHAERLNFETAAALALVAGGVWKQHAAAGARHGQELAYVGWHRVRQQLVADGRDGLAELFSVFFARRQYSDEALRELVNCLDLADWGFTRAVATAQPGEQPLQEQEQARADAAEQRDEAAEQQDEAGRPRAGADAGAGAGAGAEAGQPEAARAAAQHRGQRARARRA